MNPPPQAFRLEKTVMNRGLLIVLLTLLLLGLSGCTTPQQMRGRRIASAEYVFSTFSPEIQKKIRQGNVDIGFTQEMARLALGAPNRIYSRKTENGLSTIWSYTEWTPSPRHEYPLAPTWNMGACGHHWSPYNTFGVSIDNSREYERIRVELKQNKVLSIESTQP